MTSQYNELVEDLREKFLKVKIMFKDLRYDPPESPSPEIKNKTINILNEMKLKLESFSNKSDENDLDIKAMLAVVILHISIILIDNDELKDAEDNLMECLEIMKNFELNPKYILIVLSVYNQLGIIWYQWTEYEKAMEFVKKSESFYTDFISIDPPLEPVGMSQLFGITNNDEPNPKQILVHLYTLALYYITQVYSASKDHQKATYYCYMTLKKQLELENLDYIEWALNSATLSQLFMEKENFTNARYHLAAASYIMKLYEQSLTDSNNENDEVQIAKWENFHHRKADIAWCWAKYGIMLMDMSRDRLMKLAENIDNEKPLSVENNSDESETNNTTNSNMTFEKLDKYIKPIAEQITDNYLLDFNDAKPVFLNVQKWLNEVKEYFALETHASDYIRMTRDMSLAYKYLIFFEDNEDIHAKMHKRRIDLLESVVSELNPPYYISEIRQIWIELAETYSAILEIKLDKLRATDDKPTPHALTKINHLSESAIKYYQNFLDSLKPNESAPPVREFTKEMEEPALLAYLYLGTLHNKIINPDKNAQIKNIKNSINAYNFVVEYCEAHPDAAESVKTELSVCKDLATLWSLKLSKLAQIVSAP